VIASPAADTKDTTETRPRWRDTSRLVWQIVRDRPWPVIAMLGFLLIGNARTGLYLVAEGALVDGFFTGDQHQMLVWVFIWIGLWLTEDLYWLTKPWLFAIVKDRAVYRFQRRMMEQAASVPLVAFEHGSFHARLQRASDDIGGKLSTLLMSLIDTLQVFLMGLSVAIALWTVSPWLAPILILAAIPAIILESRVASAVQEVLKRHATNSQFLSRIEQIVRDRDAGAEIRLFGSSHVLIGRWRDTRNRRADDVLDAEWRRTKAGIGGDLVRSFAFAICIAVALWEITGQQQSIGTWVIVTTGLEWMSGFVRSLAIASRRAREQVAYAGDLFAFEEEAAAFLATANQPVILNDVSVILSRAKDRAPRSLQVADADLAPISREHKEADPDSSQARNDSNVAQTPSGTRRGMTIEVRGVSFAYPGSQRPVLADVSFSIQPGETIALVGENGAGKSTLIRLLTGLYLPDAGSVTLDGHDTRQEPAPMHRMGAVFQDYLGLQLPVRDNIGFGNPELPGDEVRLRHAAEQAGIATLVEGMPEGYDTWLGRQFGERDLSGGQWQRMALARAFYRDADLLILDEPTAALDPKAEQALFERFADLAQDRTAIMISHRLASARFADRILVMDRGRLVEQGSHEELMVREGLYARMFTAQAEWYR